MGYNLNKLKIYYQNVRGLRTKCLNLYNIILSHDYDIILITETWLQSDILDSEICDDRYDIFRCDRDLRSTGKSTGGGVMLCVRRELCARVCAGWSCCNTVESLCVTLSSRIIQAAADLHIILIYIPPVDRDLSRHVNFIQKSFSDLYNLHPSDFYLLVGDFNLPCLQWAHNGYSLKLIGNRDTQESALSLVEDMYCMGLNQYNFIPNSSNNVLDLCFCNVASTVSISQPLSKVDVHHPPLVIDITDLCIRPLKENKKFTYNFHKCDYTKINIFLNSIKWNEILQTDTLENAVDIFYDKIYECFALHIPLSTRNNSYPIWYSTALIKIIKEKSKLHKKWKRYSNPRDYDEFTLLRERQHRVQNQCFEKFTRNTEKYIRYSPKYFWKYVKSKRGGSNYPHHFTFNNQSITEGQSICAAFSNFFESIFNYSLSNSVTYNIPSSNPSSDIISRIDITRDMVYQQLSSLDKAKGAGCDGVPPIFLSNCAESLCIPVTILFQRSLDDCLFPSIWKQANIVPIHKKGSKSKIENYRPISILNTLGKVFEKIIYNNIYTVITNGISYNQHGFIRGRSTISNLSLFTDFVLGQMEGGGQVDVVYTDFEKAFDRVDHSILLSKLESLGIHGDLLRWICSYLSNRSQAVVLGGYKSDYITVPSGVPQGSHLGPLFYNAYIYDINKCFNHADHLLYADDKKIFMEIKSVKDCELMQQDLNNLYIYYSKNHITVNITKCQCISFTRKTNPVNYDYNFNGVVIERADVVRDLGVLLDTKLSMNSHVDAIVDKSFRNLGFVLRTCGPFNNILSWKIVYYAYVRSILEYASSVWSPFYAVHINRIERIQKKFLAHLNYKFKLCAPSYIENCRQFHLLTLEERRELCDMGLLYDIIRGHFDCPELLARVAVNAPSYRTRHTALFKVPFHRTNYGKNAVLTRILRTYNKKYFSIDPFTTTKPKFKNQVSSILLDSTGSTSD